MATDAPVVKINKCVHLTCKDTTRLHARWRQKRKCLHTAGRMVMVRVRVMVSVRVSVRVSSGELKMF